MANERTIARYLTSTTQGKGKLKKCSGCGLVFTAVYDLTSHRAGVGHSNNDEQTSEDILRNTVPLHKLHKEIVEV